MRIGIDHNRISDFCQRNRIAKLAFFGSVLRDDFRQESDVDVLVEFEQGARVGLLRMAALEIELSEILGRKADLRTINELSRHLRDKVAAESMVECPLSVLQPILV